MTVDSPIRRAVRNAAWLMAGKGTGGVFSLIYIGLAARSLGVEDFGIFAMILAYGQAIANLAQFQSWQTVVRYGEVNHVADQPVRLRRILYFTRFLDAESASVGAVLGVLGALLIGPHLRWSDDQSVLAAWFSLSLLFGLRGTPTGILRLFDRFDLAAYAKTVLPAMRLAGALIAFGRPGKVLAVRAATGLFYTVLLTGLTVAFEGIGAAATTVLGAVLLIVTLYVLFLLIVRRTKRKAGTAVVA